MESLDRYKRHVTKFGTDGVMESARGDLSYSELITLQENCDAADRAATRFPKRTRKSAEQKVRELLGLTDDEGTQ